MLAALAKFHGVTVDFLLGLPHPENVALLPADMYADGYTDKTFFEDLENHLRNTKPAPEESAQSTTPEWASSKDIRDFKKMLQEDVPVMFDGVPIEGEARQRVMDVLTGLFWEAKEMNKKTYGRKKKNTSDDNQE